MDQLIEKLRIPFWVLIVLLALWLIDYYKRSRLEQKLLLLQIEELQEKLSVVAKDTLIEKTISKVNII